MKLLAIFIGKFRTEGAECRFHHPQEQKNRESRPLQSTSATKQKQKSDLKKTYDKLQIIYLYLNQLPNEIFNTLNDKQQIYITELRSLFDGEDLSNNNLTSIYEKLQDDNITIFQKHSFVEKTLKRMQIEINQLTQRITPATMRSTVSTMPSQQNPNNTNLKDIVEELSNLRESYLTNIELKDDAQEIYFSELNSLFDMADIQGIRDKLNNETTQSFHGTSFGTVLTMLQPPINNLMQKIDTTVMQSANTASSAKNNSHR